MKNRKTHSSAPKGKRVRIVLRSGEIIVAKFISSTDRFIEVEGRTIAARDIRTFSINKEPT